MHGFALHQFFTIDWAAFFYQFLPHTFLRSCSQTVTPLPYVGHIVTVVCRFLTH